MATPSQRHVGWHGLAERRTRSPGLCSIRAEAFKWLAQRTYDELRAE